ncbi:MAG: gliding motility-associated C-terminal domain-containing protein [Candidatus Marinimicrobia bacterium]|nr:gliding motility-associated C-terminal domain-containing protein [Candidatus Neomarinimicrobiota bacterium]
MPQGFKNGEGKLSIYNSLGQLVKTIQIRYRHYLTWDGKNEIGKTVNSGVYYYTISYENKIFYRGSIVFLK